MAWAKLSSILEPVNLTRRLYGFDTFTGFPSISEKDQSKFSKVSTGDLYSSCYDELTELIRIYDSNRYLGHMKKVELIKDMIIDFYIGKNFKKIKMIRIIIK